MVTYRRGEPHDARTAFDIFGPTIDDLAARVGGTGNATSGDPAAWERRRALFEHLGTAGDQFWFAEVDDRPVGYARSIVRLARWTRPATAPARTSQILAALVLERNVPA